MPHSGSRSAPARVPPLAEKWLREEFDKNYKGKVPTAAAGSATPARAAAAGPSRHVKRRKTSASSFFADSDEDASGDEGEAEEDETVEIEDELKAYLELPQLKCKTEQEAIDWWVEKSKRFPNLSAMARQYLGCPATSATVERLFSRVGIAFSAKRKRSDPATVADLMFANANLP